LITGIEQFSDVLYKTTHTIFGTTPLLNQVTDVNRNENIKARYKTDVNVHML